MGSEGQEKYISTIHSVFIGHFSYTLILAFSYFYDILNIGKLEFLTLITFLWVGNLSLYFFVKLGYNQKLKEPDMFLPFIIWSISCIIIPIYYMSELLRSIFIMNYFLIVVFGVFKLNFKQFISITIYSIALYGIIIIMLMKKNSPEFNLNNEIIIWLMFSTVSIAFSFICNSLSEFRDRIDIEKKMLIQAFTDVKKISVTDDLTGIYNRRFAMDFILNKKLKVDKGADNFIICMMDIDDFKKINDTYGHDVGDVVLKRFSNEINKLIRVDDCFSRFGGEEFLLVLSQVDLKIAKEVVNRIMINIRGIKIEEIPDLKITFSAGLVVYERHTSVESLLKLSDQLLYKAKENGKNQLQY